MVGTFKLYSIEALKHLLKNLHTLINGIVIHTTFKIDASEWESRRVHADTRASISQDPIIWSVPQFIFSENYDLIYGHFIRMIDLQPAFKHTDLGPRRGILLHIQQVSMQKGI